MALVQDTQEAIGERRSHPEGIEDHFEKERKDLLDRGKLQFVSDCLHHFQVELLGGNFEKCPHYCGEVILIDLRNAIYHHLEGFFL